MKEYALGFWFLSAKSNGMVTLIQKVKPEWQAGKLNGVGGLVEEGENPLEAMQREFKEETGVETALDDWKCFGSMKFNKCVVYLFTGVATPAHGIPTTTTAEKVRTIPLRFVPNSEEVIPNIRFLTPLALQVALDPDGLNLNAEFDFAD